MTYARQVLEIQQPHQQNKSKNQHQTLLKERNIPEEWVWRNINSPDWENIGEDNNIHYLFQKYP